MPEIRIALAELQGDPEKSGAWQSLNEALPGAAGRDENQPNAGDRDASLRLIASARQEHLKRREWSAVARLLGAEATLANGSERKLERLRLEAKILRENLLEESAACRLFERILSISPQDHEASLALDESRSKRDSWRQLVNTYLAEAETAPDDLYRSSMSMRAAEVELRFAGPEIDEKRVVERLQRALELDTRNERAAEILEVLHRRKGNYKAVADVLETLLEGGETLATRVAAGVRAARVARYRLNDGARTARLYRHVLVLSPTHPEALAFLSEHYATAERWDDLVEVYETSLAGDAGGRERLGDILQIGTLLWKKRKDPASAEPWFARLRKLDPANMGMLDFYREFYEGDDAAPQLLNVLTAAQRVLPSGREKQTVAAEIAHLAAGHKDAQQAVAQYKNLLRQDPANERALSALRQLYRKTQNYAALVELLRQQLEGLNPAQSQERLAILREVAALYRNDLASDTALVSVLNQIAQLDPDDVGVARELVMLYERLGRWRDLLTGQQRLAALTKDRAERIELMRSAGRRWLDQFSNVQNATQAFEELLEASPGDREALHRLRELYKKRRAWPQLFKLYEADLPHNKGAARQELLQEMARLASERLGRGEDAARIYRQILDGDPSNSQALSSLERQAERSKDWATLAEALERRAEQTEGAQQKMVVLQKLGGVYADHLNDSSAATRTFLRLLELSPGHARALRMLRDGYLKSSDYDGLEAVYSSQHDWEGLAEVLSNAADREEDARSKVDLSYRAARVYADKLNQPARAFRSYERVLAADPTDLGAARALIAIYENEEKWARLPSLYELCLTTEEDPEERRELMLRLAAVHETKLESFSAAFDVLLKALREFTDDLSLWDRAEVLAGASGRVTELSRALRDVLRVELSEEVEVELCDRAARLHEDVLGDPIGAAPYLERLLNRDPANQSAFTRLKQILTSAERWGDLEDLYNRTTRAIEDIPTRVDLLTEVALVCEEIIEDDAKTLGYYERILEIAPTHETSKRALDRLYLRTGKYQEWANLLERHLADMTGDEALDTKLRLARVELEQLHQPGKALEHVEHVLGERLFDYTARELCESILESGSFTVRAARALEAVYESRDEVLELVQVLEIRLGVSPEEAGESPEERRELLRRIAQLKDERLHDDIGALDALARYVSEEPLDLPARKRLVEIGLRRAEFARVALVLERAAENANEPTVRREIVMEAAGIYREHLGNLEKAAAIIRGLGEPDPKDRRVTPYPLELGPSGAQRVFVSYSHDSEAHRGRVLELTQRLRRDGVDAWIDQFDNPPAEGWPRWMQKHLTTACFVLLVCTPEYRRRFDGEASAGEGKGVNFEGFLTQQQIYEDDAKNRRYIPVLLDGSERADVPLVLRSTSHYKLPRDYEELYGILTGQIAVTPVDLGTVRLMDSTAAADAELMALREKKKHVKLAGQDTADIDEMILRRRRQLRDSDDLGVGTRLNDRFELYDQVGSGGFGTVWRAWDLRDHQLVAVKVLHRQYSDDRSRRERFFRGARRMASLSHPHVVRVHKEDGRDDKAYYFVMDFLPGGDLHHRVRSGGWRPELTVPTVLSVADALRCAHDLGLVHRDVKPANILLDRNDAALLTDFDLVRAVDTTGGTRTGAMGTFIYAAPEAMVDGGRVDARADVYSLAMVAIFLLRGSDLPIETLYNSAAVIEPLNVDAALKRVLEKGSARAAAERYQTIGQFREALAGVAAR